MKIFISHAALCNLTINIITLYIQNVLNDFTSEITQIIHHDALKKHEQDLKQTKKFLKINLDCKKQAVFFYRLLIRTRQINGSMNLNTFI